MRNAPRPSPYGGDTPPPLSRRARRPVRPLRRRARRPHRRSKSRNRHPILPRREGAYCVQEWPDGSSHCRAASPRRAHAKNRSAPCPTAPARRRQGCSPRELPRKDWLRTAPAAAKYGGKRRVHHRPAPAGSHRRSAQRAPPARRKPHGRHRRRSSPRRSSPSRSERASGRPPVRDAPQRCRSRSLTSPTPFRQPPPLRRNASFRRAARRTARPAPKAHTLPTGNATCVRSPQHRPWPVSPANAT